MWVLERLTDELARVRADRQGASVPRSRPLAMAGLSARRCASMCTPLEAGRVSNGWREWEAKHAVQLDKEEFR